MGARYVTDDHQQSLGATDARTRKSLERLGLLHEHHGFLNHALQILKKARTGMEEVYTSDAESSYIHTSTMTKAIIHVLKVHGDFQAAEVEYNRQIAKADALGESYANESANLKHSLVHLYTSGRTIGPRGLPMPYRRLEGMLLDTVNPQNPSQRSDRLYTCSVDQLRQLYERQGDRVKLTSLLSMAESPLGGLVFADVDELWTSLELRRGLSSSFAKLEEPGEAEWWLLDRVQQISTSSHFGFASIEYVSNRMLLAQFYIDQGRADQALLRLHEAQNLARLILPADHVFHWTVARALEKW